MGSITEGTHAGEFIVSEGNGSISREAITVLSGQNLAAGAVIGKVANGAGSSTAFAGNTGDGAMGAITVGAGALAGVYKLVIVDPATNAGSFTVEDPKGVVVGTGNVASAFSAGGLSFTLADGATDFVAGDGFDITVAVGTNKVKEYNPANTDGSEVAVGILYDAVDASAADVSGVIINFNAEVRASDLQWFTGATSDQKTAGLADLAELGIVSR